MRSPLSGRRVLLGVTGGIAAYKSPVLASRLVADGTEVRVVMSATATEFVKPRSFDAAARCYAPGAGAAEQPEALAAWADLVLVAPASADFIARVALGRANDLLSAVCLARASALVLAPAMNHVMWRHPATQANAARLLERGVRLLGPVHGEMAEGETGVGRMMEPHDIAASLARESD